MSNIPNIAWLPDYKILGDIQNLYNNRITVKSSNNIYISTNYIIYRYVGVRDRGNNPVYEGDRLYTKNLQYIGTVEESDWGLGLPHLS